MNKKPVDYKQSDSRWASKPYNGPGESDKTIRSSGCGPTSAAMLIAALKDKSVTPVTTCAWSVKHGFKYANQGTAYAYFVPQLAAYGITCRQLLTSRILNKPDHPIHEQVRQYLQQGYWIIALMGTKANGSRGTWTSGGHYIVVWDWDTKVRILDPIHATGDNKYTNGDPAAFKDEARMYWLVDARAYNGKPVEPPKAVNYQGIVATQTSPLNCRTAPGGSEVVRQYAKGSTVTILQEQDGWGFTGEGWVDLQYIRKTEQKEDTDMDQAKFNEMFKTAMAERQKELRDNDAGTWSQEARDWAVSTGLIQGSGTLPDGTPNYMWEDTLTREQMAMLLYRFAQRAGIA